MKLINGWVFPDADRFMVQELREDGTYQKEHLDAALKFVVGDRLAIDGGAHVGTWSVRMAPQFATVLAFEPSEDTYECLVRNTSRVVNVEARNQALGKEPGHVTMTLEGLDREIANRNTGARYAKSGGTVELITIDGLNLPALDFLKLDIEGGEVDALKGATATLRKYRPVVLFEDKWHWKRYGYDRKAPHEFLASLGAQHLQRVSMDEIWGWA